MAIDQRRFHDAEVSLAEASSLDPEHPDVRALSAELIERRHDPILQQPSDPLSVELLDRPNVAAVHQPGPRLWPLAGVAVLAFAAGWMTIARLAVVFSTPRQLPVAAAVPQTDFADVTDRSTADPDPVVLPPVNDLRDAPSRESALISSALIGSAPMGSAPRSLERAVSPDDEDNAPLPIVERAVPFASAPLPDPIQRATNGIASAADVRPAIAAPVAVDLAASAEPLTNPVATPAAAAPLEPSRSAVATTSAVAAPVPEIVRPDESVLITRTLQRYRAGYDQLDADLVQAVYPAVDRSPLSRAFKDLASQSLVFDACDVAIRGTLANATCRGTASYVPRIGSPDPRIERRVWTFTLRRGEDDWTIESARTSR